MYRLFVPNPASHCLSTLATISGPLSDRMWLGVPSNSIASANDYDADRVDSARHPDRQTLPGELVDQRHQPQPLAIVGLGLDEVEAPNVVSMPGPLPDA